MSTPRLYSADTSALIDGLERYYPEETFPALWREIDGLIAANRLIISEEVWEEARVRDAATKAWCNSREKGSLVVPTDQDVIHEVQAILEAYPRLVNNQKGRNRADPFVIAVARLKNAIVVTGEGAGGTQDRPRIPYICDQLGIECIKFLDIIRLEGWKF
jgi:hypothetical protein